MNWNHFLKSSTSELWNLVLNNINKMIIKFWLTVKNKNAIKLKYNEVDPGATMYAVLANIKNMCSISDTIEIIKIISMRHTQWCLKDKHKIILK